MIAGTGVGQLDELDAAQRDDWHRAADRQRASCRRARDPQVKVAADFDSLNARAVDR